MGCDWDGYEKTEYMGEENITECMDEWQSKEMENKNQLRIEGATERSRHSS